MDPSHVVANFCSWRQNALQCRVVAVSSVVFGFVARFLFETAVLLITIKYLVSMKIIMMSAWLTQIVLLQKSIVDLCYGIKKVKDSFPFLVIIPFSLQGIHHRALFYVIFNWIVHDLRWGGGDKEMPWISTAIVWMVICDSVASFCW